MPASSLDLEVIVEEKSTDMDEEIYGIQETRLLFEVIDENAKTVGVRGFQEGVLSTLKQSVCLCPPPTKTNSH